MSMVNILPEKEGAEISLYDIALYNQWQYKQEREEDTLFITYRDKNHKKKVHQIRNPEMEIYFTKPEYRSEFRTPREYIEADKVYPVRVTKKTLLNTIYKELKHENDHNSLLIAGAYENAMTSDQWSRKKEVHKWQHVMMSDMDMESYYWAHLGYHYNTDRNHIMNICFADIENDVYQRTSMEMQNNQDPVNAVTLIFKMDPHDPIFGGTPITVRTHLLRNHDRYPQQRDFEDKLDKFYTACHSAFDEQTIIKKGKSIKVDTKAEYEILMYDNESELLKAVFDDINYYKPELCEFWNMPYDMPKMYNRMVNLGMNPTDHMCDHDLFPNDCHFINLHMDDRPIDIGNRNSYIRMTSTTHYIDQMQNYAAIRKGRKAYGSNKLDNIANIELGVGKWEFPKGVNVLNACVLDYWDFVLYNIRDVWCQYLIDYVTNDSMSLIYDMNQSWCPLHWLAKQTKYQRCIYYTEYLKRGYIPGNNINVDYTRFYSEEKQEDYNARMRRQQIREVLDKAGYDADEIREMLADADLLNDALSDADMPEEEEEVNALDALAMEEINKENTKSKIDFNDSVSRRLPLQGGLVGNPNLNSANGVEITAGVRSKHIFDHVLDEDYSSEYPWAKFTRSISRSTQIGRLIIPKKISDYQCVLPLGMEKRDVDKANYLPGAEFVSDYISQDWLSFGAVWFNLPRVEECNELVDKMLKEDIEE